MDVRVCKGCRRLFNYVYGSEYCPECLKQRAENSQEDTINTKVTISKKLDPGEADKYEQVKEYIMVNPKATVAQIAEANGVIPAKLFEWIKDDRLEFTDDSSQAWFSCEKCGRKIRSGRLCNRCKE